MNEIDEEKTYLNEVYKSLPYEMKQIEKVLDLTIEGNTIPFIARYRKEVTGYLDEVAIKEIIDTYLSISKLEKRRNYILEKVLEKGEIKKGDILRIKQAATLNQLERLYSVYKEKKSRKVAEAVEKGLEGIGEDIKHLLMDSTNPTVKSNKKSLNVVDFNAYLEKVSKENPNVKTKEEVKSLAKEVMKEEVVNNAELVDTLHGIYQEDLLIVSKVVDKEKDVHKKYEKYYNYSEKLHGIASHRLFAMLKGQLEGVLKISYVENSEKLTNKIENEEYGNLTEINDTELKTFINEVVKESYSKRIKPKLHRLVEKETKETGDDESIVVFKRNLQQQLLKAPERNKRILCIDPAYRTGCKLAMLDESGNVLGIDVIYPHAPKNQWDESKIRLSTLLDKYNLNYIVVGNGTASRESEKLVRELLEERKKNNKSTVSYEVVDESGASVYSASAIAREEFPNYSVEQRSAISLGRRLQDPLSELVKIDPRSIGVGQYQHLVDEKKLTESLEYVVYSVVNRVGVDVNTASLSLLRYISGLNEKIAKSIIQYRQENGPFKKRTELKKVKGLGPKAYEQCIGFLRIYGGTEKLDETGIHPSDYREVKALMKKHGISNTSIGKVELKAYIERNKDEFTLAQYENMLELGNGRTDVREKYRVAETTYNREFDDLSVGDKVQGIVRNITNFGVFVDIGLKNDGFIHISKISNKFVRDIFSEVRIGEIINCEILEKDEERKKISMRKL